MLEIGAFQFNFSNLAFVTFASVFMVAFYLRVLPLKYSVWKSALLLYAVRFVADCLNVVVVCNASSGVMLPGVAVLVFDFVASVLMLHHVTQRSYARCIVLYLVPVAIVYAGYVVGTYVFRLTEQIVPEASFPPFLQANSRIILIDLFQALFLMTGSELIGRRANRIHAEINWSTIAMFLLTQIIGEFLMVALSTWNEQSFDRALLLLVYTLVCIATDIYLIHTFRSMVKNAELTQRVTLLNQQKTLERAQFAAVGEQMTAMRRLQHDYQNTLSTIGALLDMGELDKVKSLLAGTAETLEHARLVRTGNQIVDAVICAKTASAAERGVALRCNLLWPEAFEIEDTDVMRIFTNLIDNAIRYCETLPAAQRYVELTSALQGHMVVLCFANPFVGDAAPELPVEPSNPMAAHGHGLAIVQEIAVRYGGALTVRLEDGRLVCRVLLSLNSLGAAR